MPINRTKKPIKKVVYLLGTGATHAELMAKGRTSGIIMRDVKDEMLSRIDKLNIKQLKEIKNELTPDYADIEHLITLYESTGIPRHVSIAKHLKNLFKEIVQERTKGLNPKLLSALIDMHNIALLNEELKGILTLNYEDILDKAVQEVKKGINYAIEINCKHSSFQTISNGFPLLKLHGSFNWKNEFPITLTDDHNIKNPEYALWIPPGIEKRREKYPFSILWGRAKEILNCDILRVIGCSLNRNDWQLVSLLYTTQKLNCNSNKYDIELIDYFNSGNGIKNNYSYLQFRLISEIKEVKYFIKKAYFPRLKEEAELTKSIENLLRTENKSNNIFDIWLKAKGEYLKDDGINFEKEAPIFYKYIYEVST